MLAWLSVLIVAATLALMLVRPRGLLEAWAAVLGAAAMALVGAIGFGDVAAVVAETSDVLLFLLGMMVLTGLVERAGIFDWLAASWAGLARGSGLLLFTLVFVLGAVVTVFLSLDATVIILTPIVYALVSQRRLDATPYMFACTFVANTASLALPISNLTNLLVFHQLGLGFAAFASRMWLPTLAAVGTNFAAFAWLFRDRLARRFDPVPAKLPPTDRWFRVCAAVLALSLLGLLALGFLDLPLSPAPLAGSVVLLALGRNDRRASFRAVVGDVSWPLFAFVVGMFLVVRGFEHFWLAQLSVVLPADPLSGLVVAVVGAAVGSNVVNNVPVTILGISLLKGAALEGAALKGAAPAVRDLAAYGALVGANVGPTATTYGSLATMLWLSLVRQRGVAVSTWDYMKVGLVTMPVVLVAATLALWLVSR